MLVATSAGKRGSPAALSRNLTKPSFRESGYLHASELKEDSELMPRNDLKRLKKELTGAPPQASIF